jgi:ribose transport system substrate-binding protein
VKKIRHGRIGAVAAASAALALAACGSVASSSAGGTSAGGITASGTATGNSGAGITIAGVYGGTSDPFWVTFGCGAQQEAAALGVKYQAFSSTTLDTSAFSQNFSSAQLTKPNGMFVEPANPNQFITQYKSLMSSGVPILTFNSTTPPAQYKTVGTGTSDSPSLLQQVASLVTASSGSMLVVNGIPGLVPVEVRLNPVVQAIQSAHPGLTSLPTIYSQFDVNKATQSVSSDLIANPNLKVIVAADGPDGQAVAAAVQAAHKSGQVTVISLDATPAEVSALRAGTISGLVAQSPQQIGEDQIKELVSYVKAHPNGGAVPVNAGTISVPQALLTKSNVDAPSNSAYIYKASC